MKIGEYVERMSVVWIEGQVVQLTTRPGSATAYLTLRDTDVDLSLSVVLAARILSNLPAPLSEGARVVVHAKPVFWPKRGSLHLEARAIRPVGIGELLARLEHLKRVLAAEGLFAAERKKTLPFLPTRIGLICGRSSAAEHDVVENAKRRYPAVRFELRQVPVQGPEAVSAVIAALTDLQRDPNVEVIVIARGGGSVEDLLPFSNEALIRAVAAATVPIVSAIGHDVDTPLLDLVADVRASTPTDAAKRIVPDVAEELARIVALRERVGRCALAAVQRQRSHLLALCSRPVLAQPSSLIDSHRQRLELLCDRARRQVQAALAQRNSYLAQLAAQLRALSPQATLDRGYALVQHADGRVVRERESVEPRELLRVRVADGDFGVHVVG